jgi:hypothetical protein
MTAVPSHSLICVTHRPVDVTSRDREINEKLEKERESRVKDKAPLGSGWAGPISRQGSTSGGPPTRAHSTPRDGSPADDEKKERAANKFDSKAAQVRSQTSFAAAAGGNKKEDSAVDKAAEKLAEATI